MYVLRFTMYIVHHTPHTSTGTMTDKPHHEIGSIGKRHAPRADYQNNLILLVRWSPSTRLIHFDQLSLSFIACGTAFPPSSLPLCPSRQNSVSSSHQLGFRFTTDVRQNHRVPGTSVTAPGDLIHELPSRLSCFTVTILSRFLPIQSG